METYPTQKARGKLGDLLKEAQWDEIPFMLRVRQQEAAVGAPYRWFERACRALDGVEGMKPPEVTAAKTNFNAMRNDLVPMCNQVMYEQAFIKITRLGGPACVLVPIPWYEKAVTLVGAPAGEPETGDGSDPGQGAPTGEVDGA